jgi:hypothetical protein
LPTFMARAHRAAPPSHTEGPAASLAGPPGTKKGDIAGNSAFRVFVFMFVFGVASKTRAPAQRLSPASTSLLHTGGPVRPTAVTDAARRGFETESTNSDRTGPTTNC